jgi:gliding motility-associated-like protein
VNPVPAAPSANDVSFCPNNTVTLHASGATNGQYRWYTAFGAPVVGETNDTFVTPVLPATNAYSVAINNGTCESTRTLITITADNGICNNHPPVIETEPASTQIGGIIEIELSKLISDEDNNIDLATLSIVTPPGSGAVATIVGNVLIINYSGNTFTGTESITLRVCDIYAACTEESFNIQVDGSVKVYNALSPGGDGKNDEFFIQNIDRLTGTQRNHVSIFNRWGDLVWEADNYNNVTVVFTGKSKNGADLPSGTYYYKIDFEGSTSQITGYLSLKR